MAEVKITDEASLEAWLKKRPRRDAEIIAFRAAARVFPLWGRAMEEEWAETEAIANKLEYSAVVYFRFLLILLAKLKFGDTQFELLEARLSLTYHYVGGTPASRYAIISAINAGHGRANNSIFAAISALAIVQDRRVSWKMIEYEFIRSTMGQNLIQDPLWHTPAPDWFTAADRETRAIWAKDPDIWRFWEKWWDGVISGDMPFAEGLLRDVALIEDDIWQAGPKAVAAAIEKIEKIHDLRAQLAVLTQAMEDEDLSQAQRGATLAHRGHNNPPEIIEAYEIVQASAVDITQALNDAREELAKPAPEPSRLQAIGNWMRSSIMKAAGYCGGLADKFLQEFAGEMGKQAATVVAWLIKGGIGVSLLTAFAKSMISVWPM